MRSIVLVSALAVLTAACGQIPGMEETEEAPAAEAGADAGTPASAEEAGVAPEAPSDPQDVAVLNVESPTVSDIEGYWWVRENGTRSSTYRDGVLIDISLSESDVQRFEYEKITDCQARQPDQNGRAMWFSFGACGLILSVADNALIINYWHGDERYRLATDEQVQDFEARVAAAG